MSLKEHIKELIKDYPFTETIMSIQLTMALHQRQRQSCKRRTLPQVLSHTVHLALTGRFPSNHWCGIEICKWYRGREAIWTFQSATQGCRIHCGTETYREASLDMHCLRTAMAISRKHLRTCFGILCHTEAQRDQVTRPRLPRRHWLALDTPYAKVLIYTLVVSTFWVDKHQQKACARRGTSSLCFYLSFDKIQTRFPMPPII